MIRQTGIAIKKDLKFVNVCKFFLQIVKIVFVLVFERFLGTMKVLQFVEKFAICKKFYIL